MRSRAAPASSPAAPSTSATSSATRSSTRHSAAPSMRDDGRVKLEGIHHITAITGDAQKNVDFYAGVLGLRLVKKSVNQDQTSVYHLFYADETGDPGSDMTFFEYPGLPRGRAGAGMIHRIVWRVASKDAL